MEKRNYHSRVIDNQQLIAEMQDHFDKIRFNWNPGVPTGPIKIPRALGSNLNKSSERLLRLLRRTAFEISDDPIIRHNDIGLDDRLKPLYQNCPIERSLATIIARPDAILTASGWKFIEMNVSSAVGGLVEVHLFNEFWKKRTTSDWFRFRSTFHDRSTMLKNIARQLNISGGIDIVACSDDAVQKYSRYYDLEAEELNRVGFNARWMEADDYLKAATNGADLAPLVLQEFVSQDWLDTDRDLGPAISLRGGGRIVLSSHSAEHVSNKRMLARLSAHPSWLNSADASFVDQYVPWTREVDDGPVTYQGQKTSLTELLLDQQHRFVLKRSDGNRGDNIHLGASLTPSHWRSLIEIAVRAGTWVVQERIHPIGINVEIADTKTGDARQVAAPAIFGPYLFGGVASGCLVRYDSAGLPGGDVLSQAIPTVLVNSAVWPG